MLVGDLQLKSHIEDELSWEPSINSAAIGVAVQDAVVTVTGRVNTYAEKHAVEQAILRIHGVRALANELDVRLPAESERPDEDIATAIAEAFLWNTQIPRNAIRVQVSSGWVTLQGTVDWEYQRRLAERTATDLMGVRGVSNQLTIRPFPLQQDVKTRIESALQRNAELNSQHISVAVKGDKVILSGAVQSLATRVSAERAAWKAPGVLHVENNLQVSPEIERQRFD